MNTEAEILSTAGLVSAQQPARSPREVDPAHGASTVTGGITAITSANDADALAPLFQPEEAEVFRGTWDLVQIGFVDDPKGAVRRADDLVTQVMKTLAESFSNERAKLESQAHTDGASTENLRVSLRRYRSFFQRLLAL